MSERVADPFEGDPHPPDGWIIRHARYNDTVTFGPFATWDEMCDWIDATGQDGSLVPCWRSVDWNRSGLPTVQLNVVKD